MKDVHTKSKKLPFLSANCPQCLNSLLPCHAGHRKFSKNLNFFCKKLSVVQIRRTSFTPCL